MFFCIDNKKFTKYNFKSILNFSNYFVIENNLNKTKVSIKIECKKNLKNDKFMNLDRLNKIINYINIAELILNIYIIHTQELVYK